MASLADNDYRAVRLIALLVREGTTADEELRVMIREAVAIDDVGLIFALVARAATTLESMAMVSGQSADGLVSDWEAEAQLFRHEFLEGPDDDT